MKLESTKLDQRKQIQQLELELNQIVCNMNEIQWNNHEYGVLMVCKHMCV